GRGRGPYIEGGGEVGLRSGRHDRGGAIGRDREEPGEGAGRALARRLAIVLAGGEPERRAGARRNSRRARRPQEEVGAPLVAMEPRSRREELERREDEADEERERALAGLTHP